jgi:iron complex outermembrane recepter protein
MRLFFGHQPHPHCILPFTLVFALFAAPLCSLTAQDRGVLTGRITDRRTGLPVAAAAITMSVPEHATSSRADGSYRIEVPAGRREIRVQALGYRVSRDTVDITANATASRDIALTPSVLDLQQVVVTGTRRQDRTVVDAPVPIDVFTARDIKMSGRTETAAILAMLAPSLNFPRTSVSDGTDHVRPATLRGLGPDQVLILVNGKRRHTSSLVNVNNTVGRGSSAVDLNAIPASAIERIEVLRDGAAAQYGSDAIAGVINVILKTDAPSELASTVGQTAEGDGRTLQFGGSHSLALGRTGYFTVSGELRLRDSTNRAKPDPRPQYFPGDPRNTEAPRVRHWLGDSKTVDYGAFFNAAKPLSAGAQLYAFGGTTARAGQAAGQWRRPLQDQVVRAIHPNGFLPYIVSDIQDYSLGAGVKGELGGWSYDLSSLYGGNSFEFSVEHSNNASMGTASPTTFRAGTLGSSQLTANLDFVRQLSFGLPRPVSVAVGAEVRRDSYRIEAGEPASYIDGKVRVLDGPSTGALAPAGAQVFPGFRPADEVDESRSNIAAYIDLETAITSRWTVGLAGRTEDYTDFGSATTGKVASRFEIVRGVAVRAAFATGYRAPSLSQAWFSSTATNFLGNPPTPVENRTFPVSTPVAKLLGAEPLRPEKSVNLSYGITLQPIENFTLSADRYQIDIDDRVVLSGNMINGATTALLAANGFAGVGGARYFTNAIDTKTQGVDVVGSYGLAVGRSSTMRLSAAFNQNRNRITRVRPTPSALSSLGEALFDRTERVRFVDGQPPNNVRLMAEYTVGRFGVVVQEQRYGEVSIAPTPANPAFDQTFPARWLSDLSATYQATAHLTIAAGADNLFNQYPGETIAANSNNGAFPYSSFSPFGFNGRFLFVRAIYRR